jgi:septal ring factor EnvC (AmiA/AmiB activator)
MMEHYTTRHCLDILQTRIQAAETAAAVAVRELSKARADVTQHSQKITDILFQLDELQEQIHSLLMEQDGVIHA